MQYAAEATVRFGPVPSGQANGRSDINGGGIWTADRFELQNASKYLHGKHQKAAVGG